MAAKRPEGRWFSPTPYLRSRMARSRRGGDGNHPDRIQITFDDRRLVANAGLLLPATLARHLGLAHPSHRLPQAASAGPRPGRPSGRDEHERAGGKMMTLVASALAGGDCMTDDDADVLRTGGHHLVARHRPGRGAAGRVRAGRGRWPEGAPWAARSRRHPPWAPSCAASGGATSVNSTG